MNGTDALARVKEGVGDMYDGGSLYYVDSHPTGVTIGDFRAIVRECEAARALFATLQSGPARIVYALLEQVSSELAAYNTARKGSG